MKRSINISNIFPNYLFWDMDMNKLDFKKDKDIIIPRALFATNSDTFDEDILRLEKIYDKLDIIKELKSTKEKISNQVCSMIAERYHIPSFSRYSL
ncbi:hypothetical protein DU508_15415 [Pedobacter chinensis]|uniref:DUF6922 domain-containing protein n=1 Tax=Pedobacter chinensis TaxID=2282421 RepID=A0A369PTS7_9SPHI|nr:hypothetical protein DU508_15415 [Pedobacter chinensis]